MVEYVIVGVLVGAAVLLAARNLYRRLAGKAPNCSCGQRCADPTACRTPPEEKPNAEPLERRDTQ